MSEVLPPTGPLVLVVEDEPRLRGYLRTILGAHGHPVLEAADAAEGEALAAEQPALVLLDLGLPDLDGIHLVPRLKARCPAPIIVLSARGQEGDKVQALDAGADDYLTKPFGTGELLARMRAALRRGGQPTEGSAAESVVETPRWRLDLGSRALWVEGEPVHLTPTEFALLSLLARNAGKVLTQTRLLQEVWGRKAGVQPHYLRVYMAQLRHKIEKQPARPEYLFTEPGVGYRLRV